ncbi:MAG TPA: penicillin-binding protein 2 [Acidimicrobiales bacterium]|nr:penicillin-binding protein 2 [Acidimicrobiales bacterium]
MSVLLGVVVVRLLFVQGISAGKYLADARSEYVHEISFLGERGAILDRNGDELAMSVPMTTVYADPYQVTNPAQEARDLAAALGVPVGPLQADLSEASGFVYLARTIPNATAARVEKLLNAGSLPGVYTMQEPKRFYPAGQLASPLIGSVGIDGQGLSGLEYKYNSLLAGKPGKLVEDMDPAGGEIPGGVQEYQAPVRGDDLVLSIDEPLQYEAEEALARAIVAAQADSGMALIMDSRTGELLAVAQLTMPTPAEPATMNEPPALPVWFIPPGGSSTTTAGTSANGAGANGTGASLASAQPVEAPSASAFTTVYEPGSVEKLVTVSAALSTGAVQPDDYFDIPDTYEVAGSIFSDAWPHPTLDWSISNIIAHSSDIGTIEIAQRLGLPRLVQYIHDFGIGEMTDVNFPGESAGIVPTPSQWSGTTIATVPIGQGLAVTAVQMLSAYNTIANGGIYIPPRLVNGYVDAAGQEHLFPSPARHRVVSPAVAADMTSMLEGVVRVGTGTAANLEPYTVAGKTGTALVPLPTGGYSSDDFVSSFAGFVPAEDPAITAMVVVSGTHQYGAEASAPVFATIVRDALQALGIPPHKPAPPVAGVPLATPYGDEGEAAGPALPGLVGSPDVQVGATSQTTGGQSKTLPSSTTTNSSASATTTPPASTTTTVR